MTKGRPSQRDAEELTFGGGQCTPSGSCLSTINFWMKPLGALYSSVSLCLDGNHNTCLHRAIQMGSLKEVVAFRICNCLIGLSGRSNERRQNWL